MDLAESGTAAFRSILVAGIAWICWRVLVGLLEASEIRLNMDMFDVQDDSSLHIPT